MSASKRTRTSCRRINSRQHERTGYDCGDQQLGGGGSGWRYGGAIFRRADGPDAGGGRGADDRGAEGSGAAGGAAVDGGRAGEATFAGDGVGGAGDGAGGGGDRFFGRGGEFHVGR